jgi:hypothetical protein
MADNYTSTVDPYWAYGPGNPFAKPEPTHPVSSLGLDAIGVLNEMGEMKKNYDSLARFAAQQYVIDRISPQLPTGQDVTVLVRQNGDSFTAESIERPGKAYMSAPNSDLLVVPVKGPEADKCYAPGKQPEERTVFQIDGQKFYLDAKGVEQGVDAKKGGDPRSGEKLFTPTDRDTGKSEERKTPANNESQRINPPLGIP